MNWISYRKIKINFRSNSRAINAVLLYSVFWFCFLVLHFLRIKTSFFIVNQSFLFSGWKCNAVQKSMCNFFLPTNKFYILYLRHLTGFFLMCYYIIAFVSWKSIPISSRRWKGKLEICLRLISHATLDLIKFLRRYFWVWKVSIVCRIEI